MMDLIAFELSTKQTEKEKKDEKATRLCPCICPFTVESKETRSGCTGESQSQGGRRDGYLFQPFQRRLDPV
jgi:hypothetical protein